MNMRSKLVAITGSALILASSIMTGTAAETDTGNATVSITSSSTTNVLSVSITDGTFVARPYSLSTQTTTGNMTVTADDMRGTAAGWSVNLNATNFAPFGTAEKPVNLNAQPIPIRGLSLTPAANYPVLTPGVTQPGATIGTQTPHAIDVVSTEDQLLWEAANGSGAGSFDLLLNGSLDIPEGTLVGDYKSTVTVSIASGPAPVQEPGAEG